MPQSFRSFLALPTDPHDLFQVARDFLDNIQQSSPFSSPFITIPGTGPSAQLSTLLAGVPAGFQNTLLRCINAQLRFAQFSVWGHVSADSALALRLSRARTDRSDINVNPPFSSPMLAYSYYASIADAFGSADSQSALAEGKLQLLGIRVSTSTLANKGRGSYDDAIVVLKGIGLARTAVKFAACTEPGAQYSQRAQLKPKGKPNERLDARYSDVKYRKADGVDINSDGTKDAGRLVEGTYQYAEKPGGHLGARAFKVGTRTGAGKASRFTAGAAQVTERDTDGDGLFTAADPSRNDPTGAGVTMYIHKGGADNIANINTWSAGCQTIPGNVYKDFLAHIPTNANFKYVLVNAT